MIVTVDKYTRVVLTVIAALLTVVAVGMWIDAPSAVPAAQAAIPDSGAQLQQILDTNKAIKSSLGEFGAVLRSGQVKVQIVEPTGKAKASAAKAVPVTPVTPR